MHIVLIVLERVPCKLLICGGYALSRMERSWIREGYICI